jgi:adenine-specific DNA-methyltransferase
MSEESTGPAPMLDPARNSHLSAAARPPHVATQLAPAGLLAPAPHPEYAARFEQLLGTLRVRLGEPAYARHGFILYEGDCLERMRQLQTSDLQVELTITSPPYNIGKAYESRRDLTEYVRWCESWLAQVHALTAPSGALWLNLGYLEVPEKGLCVPIPYLLWDRTPFYLLQEVVWHYGAGVATKTRFSPRNEKWLFYAKDRGRYAFNLDAVRDPDVKYPHQKKNGKLKCNPLGKNPSDVWAFPKVTSGDRRSSRERTRHPAQFPLRVVDRIVKVSSESGDLVLDPFSGSGSTGIAAVGNGRLYLGFEQRVDYCRLAVERFEAFVAQRADERAAHASGPRVQR